MSGSDFVSRYRDAVTALVNDLEKLSNLQKRWEAFHKAALKDGDFVGENAGVAVADIAECVDWVCNLTVPECCYKLGK